MCLFLSGGMGIVPHGLYFFFPVTSIDLGRYCPSVSPRWNFFGFAVRPALRRVPSASPSWCRWSDSGSPQTLYQVIHSGQRVAIESRDPIKFSKIFAKSHTSIWLVYHGSRPGAGGLLDDPVLEHSGFFLFIGTTPGLGNLRPLSDHYCWRGSDLVVDQMDEDEGEDVSELVHQLLRVLLLGSDISPSLIWGTPHHILFF